MLKWQTRVKGAVFWTKSIEKFTGFPRSGKSQGKIKKVQGQGKVREFCFWSGKFEILAKVREKSGNFRIKSQTIFFSDDSYSSKSINSNDFQLLGELCYS